MDAKSREVLALMGHYSGIDGQLNYWCDNDVAEYVRNEIECWADTECGEDPYILEVY